MASQIFLLQIPILQMRLSVAAHHHEMTQPFKKPYTPAFQKALFPKVTWPWKRNLYFPKFSKSWFVNAVAILKFKAEEHFFFSSIIKKRITACHTFRGKYSQKYPALQRSKSFRICAQHRMQMCHFRTPRYVCAAAKYKQVCNKAGESFRAIHWRNNMCGDDGGIHDGLHCICIWWTQQGCQINLQIINLLLCKILRK